MRFARSVGLLLALTIVGLAAVHLRAEQTRSAATRLRLEAERMQLRRELWALRARAARLRCPQRIANSAERMAAHLEAPFVPDGKPFPRKHEFVARSAE